MNAHKISGGHSVHLPRLTLGRPPVSSWVALTRKHTGAAGGAHAAKSFLVIIQYHIFHNNESVII